MDPFFDNMRDSVALLLAIVLFALKSSYWVYIWQLKEYRTDRMRDFLSTPSGKKTTTNFRTIIEFIFVVVFCITTIIQSMSTSLEGALFAELLSWIFFLFILFEIVTLLQWRAFPVWTAKAILLSFLGVIFTTCMTLLFAVLITGSLGSIAIILFLTPIIISAIILVLQPFTTIQKKRIIGEAKKKISTLNPIVVGITGSYGKSSTKEFLRTILEDSFLVLATEKNINVDIGVAKTILNNLNSHHDIFIVEMGAYRQGEIKSICDLASPIIGVVTAISDQHLALFGSTEIIRKTKAELIESLPSNGVAILNRDNPGCVEISELTRAEKKFFSQDDIAHVYSSDIDISPTLVQFTLHIGDKQKNVRTRLHGKQVIPSILAAATVADHLGVSIEQIAKKIESLQPLFGTMRLSRGVNFSTIIDDHYNSNPDGFLAALDYLGIFTDKRKIVITPGMLELGSESDAHHRNVGSRVGEVADVLIITKEDFAKPLKDAATQHGLQGKQIIVSDKPGELIRQTLSQLGDQDVVLIEGRVHRSISDYLIQE